jgi:hypothetical protein
MPWFLISNMGVAASVAKIEGAMREYKWKSRHGQYPGGYTEKYFRDSDRIMYSQGGSRAGSDWTAHDIAKEIKRYVKQKRREIRKKLREYI